MKLRWLALFLICGTALAQTTIRGNLNVVPAVNSSPTGLIEIAPATATFPCPAGQAAADKTYGICGAGGAITVDFGDGKGFVPLTGVKGDKGDTGPAGAQGQAATVTVGTTTSGPVAAVTNSGTSTAAILNFVLPLSPVKTAFTCFTVTFSASGATFSGCQ